MTFHFKPAKRERTPLIIGIAGPTKSGKTLSAHRVAAGLANSGPVAMINAEGAKGHQYADQFEYLACDISPPYRPERYIEVLKAALAINPAVVIIDSMSHMHDGPGGMLEYHEAELDRIAGNDMQKRQKASYSGWVKPKAVENAFIYAALEADCHLIWCFRAKEKIKIVNGKPVEMGWQPIMGDRVSFETMFTLMLPPHSKGVPDISLSDMRDPFDKLIPAGKQLSEETGRLLGQWAAGGSLTEGAGGVEGPRAKPSAQASAENGTTGQEVGLTAPSVSDPATGPQKKKLNVLVGQLRDGGHIKTEQLYTALQRVPEPGEDGEIHWAPLRDSLSKDEAGQLIERLERFQANVKAAESERETAEIEADPEARRSIVEGEDDLAAGRVDEAEPSLIAAIADRATGAKS